MTKLSSSVTKTSLRLSLGKLSLSAFLALSLTLSPIAQASVPDNLFTPQAGASASNAKNWQSYLPSAQMGIYAVNLDTQKVLISYNAFQNMQPASTQKILTAYLVARNLQATDTFTTKVYAQAAGNGAYDVTIQFAGDPTFGAGSVNSIANQLKQAGITNIHQLTYDVSKYSGHDRPLGWNWANNSMCFSSENSAAQYNRNCLVGTLNTNKPVGSIATLEQTDSRVIRVEDQIRIVAPSNAANCEQNYTNPSDLGFTLQGCIAQSKQGLWLNFAVPNGNAYATRMVGLGLNNNGIRISNTRLQSQATSPAGNLVAQVNSSAMTDLLSTMLSKSENHYAEQLYRHTIYQLRNTPVSYTLAKRVNAQLMQGYFTTGTARFSGVQVDGSGLSYYNTISAADMTRVMASIYLQSQNPSAYGLNFDLYSLFPSENDGTLKLHNSFAGHSLRGKTGSIYGAENFTGILTTKSGQRIAFTYFINNSTDSSAATNRFTADLLNYLDQ
ncbi:D-alanyl-D-alanine carboxypeptidase/D-alanyl-D-alanine endopeptidase [Psittacicella hinzii]|uniref:D-alanyl-D-alanine carboxypeptidase/D-alanyl-D-alanine-endopeptidase n=1 Tax=Psittacicella hinzii TaxID=2028575 RepID=A0A3A1YPH3_9GAMM|nr:D-alanyl-D-alanine carboxypeptidase/D-alanyl-D-alanine-endopeptidase [Psittacicella hinzii]RIY39128.1 D-alanyl-D-alanine carboxypeptidase/D-alanyl-D-alanine-endopeptidase [Psittacicella hinzii]